MKKDLYFLITHKLEQYFKCSYFLKFDRWKASKKRDKDALQVLAELCKDNDINPFDFCFYQFEYLRRVCDSNFSPSFYVTEKAMDRYIRAKIENFQKHKGTLTAKNDFQKSQYFYDQWEHRSKDELLRSCAMAEITDKQLELICSIHRIPIQGMIYNVNYQKAYAGLKISLDFYEVWKECFVIPELDTKEILLLKRKDLMLLTT